MSTNSDLLRGLALNYSTNMLRHMLRTTLMRHLRSESSPLGDFGYVTYLMNWGITRNTVSVPVDTWVLIAQRALSLQERGYGNDKQENHDADRSVQR